jgi:hypothetical protein
MTNPITPAQRVPTAGRGGVMTKRDEFEVECRARFAHYCRLYAAAPFHIDKRTHAESAWAEIDAYLDWLDIRSL